MIFNGQKLKRLRKATDLNWNQFSELLDMPVDTLYGYESGRRVPTSNNLMKLCEKLKVKPEFFYEDQAQVYLNETEINK